MSPHLGERAQIRAADAAGAEAAIEIAIGTRSGEAAGAAAAEAGHAAEVEAGTEMAAAETKSGAGAGREGATGIGRELGRQRRATARAVAARACRVQGLARAWLLATLQK